MTANYLNKCPPTAGHQKTSKTVRQMVASEMHPTVALQMQHLQYMHPVGHPSITSTQVMYHVHLRHVYL
jgi:hypothetical protein